jgi:hypothetical protein
LAKILEQSVERKISQSIAWMEYSFESCWKKVELLVVASPQMELFQEKDLLEYLETFQEVLNPEKSIKLVGTRRWVEKHTSLFK